MAALVFSTTAAFWALVYNRRQARAVAQANALTEKAQREQAEPYVIVDIRPRIPGSSLLVLVIETFGRVDPLIYTVDLEALRDSALETDSVEWSTHQIAKHLKRSADAQEEQSRSVEALSIEVRKRLGRQSSERTSGVEAPELAEPALLEIPMRPLRDDGDLE
ncbi:hypothetical protein HEK616_59720 [Streptomyces nigrescens]|uniref:Secreted protein n=1 Tax=Streptomyces nigrescens TaxID=1920 RepID=A0ABM8A1I8_STRNI|nr:hypothetical protein [Streptomyces nigrescens]BDM72485.1 hypothetical protein HEK616_59720 [Streptomyces nigrescens]